MEPQLSRLDRFETFYPELGQHREFLAMVDRRGRFSKFFSERGIVRVNP
jgi:hypothetical protein